MKMGIRGVSKNLILIIGYMLLGINAQSAHFSTTTYILNFEINNDSCKEDATFCATLESKPFSNEEVLFLNQSLNKLLTIGLADFLADIQGNGFLSFNRYTYGFNLSPLMANSISRSTSQFAFTDSRSLTFNLLDLFFANPIKIDPISGASIKDIGLLHELVHARDVDARFSSDPEFLRLAGYVDGEITGSSIQERSLIKESLYDLNQKNDVETAYLLERRYGMSAGAPRLYSLESPQEFLADAAAFIIYDKTVDTYMNPDLIRWIKRNVLLITTN